MSDTTKPVEEPVAPVVPTEAPAAEPVTETKAAEEPVAETPAVTEPATTEEAVPATEEVKPVEEGILGYKGPGLVKGLWFQKKFFWFGSEPVDHKSLSNYLRGEKEYGNAAWASETGKGLLFFSKKSAEKATPAGIINLSEASEVSTDGLDVFHFTIDGHKHAFETAGAAERDNWVAVLKTKIAEAKELAPTVKESESYKKTHEKLSPTVVAPVLAAKKEEKVEAKEEKKEAKEEKKEEKAEAKEEKKEEKKEIKERKSRSASRKRTSIFGSIPGFGKKEEKTEAKEEVPAVVPAAEPVAEPAAAETAPVTEEAIATEPVAPVVEEPAAPVEAKAPTSKRSSIFGTLKSKYSHSSKPEKKEEAAPAVPAKDAEPVSETAPVIPAVESTEPLAASVVSPATAPVEATEAPVTNGEAKTETPVVKSDKRKSSLPWLNAKTEKVASEDEAEKPSSPLFAKIRKTFKGKNPKTEKAAEKATEPETAAPETEATKPVEEPVVSEPTPVINSASPQVSATA